MSLHPLTIVRRQLEMNITTLSRLSGVAVETITRIEKGSERRVNYSTAEALADAVKQPLHTLFFSDDLTHVGRPARTGCPVTREVKRATSGVFCFNCFLEAANKLPEDGCENCGHNEFGHWGDHNS